ncbi:penicilin amidase [Methylomonas koyamae]|uniref:Penicilin amidase n=1 Tax=Methylomonas koyamae TaxID=702114 RepID=A0A177NZ60_9GAMM|nr:penicilin amidase [Methylomonas koyamae]
MDSKGFKDMTWRSIRYLRIWLGLLVLGCAWLLFRQALPEVTYLKVPGLPKAIEVVRDSHAVPHIYADTADDAYFALGYLHAQDRLWQMDLNRRAGSGRLAEIFGGDALEQDRFMRVLGLRRAAQANLQQLDPATLASLQAYAQGVNAFLAQESILPVEFYLTGAPRPEPWQPADSLVWLKTMAWRLSGNWWEELLNLKLQQRLSPEQFADLFPPYPGEAPHALPDVRGLYAELAPLAGKLLAQHRGEVHKSVGSNNWVVDGSRTASGKPLLANDPHLPLTAPSLWYFAHLHAPGLNIVGATLPGIPGILLGQNPRVAWSFTNTGPDSQDIFLEQQLSDQPNRYLTPAGSEVFTTIREIIKVKNQADQELTIRVSRHGPVISDVDNDARQAAPNGMAAVLSWVGLREDDATIRFMLNAGRAQSASELKVFARDFHTPQQNIVYADVDGNIGFIAAGRVPVRGEDNVLNGRLPAPGWLAAYDWQGLIPYEQLPQQAASEDGKIVTANQKITPPAYPYFITSGWALPYRAERIGELLDRRAKHDVASFAAIQNDVVNPFAAQLLPRLLKITVEELEAKQILQGLRDWDRRMSGDAAEPLIFAEWIRQLAVILYQEKLGDLSELVGDYQPQFLLQVLNNSLGGADRWCAAVASGMALCDTEIKQALQAALTNLERHYGADLGKWRWGKAHVTVFNHHPFGQVPFLSTLFNVEGESAGGMDTVNVSGYRYDEDGGHYLGEAGAAFRAIYDLAEPENSVFILGTGQSGNPFSSHYRDMTSAWLHGGYVSLTTDRERIMSSAVERIQLQPE